MICREVQRWITENILTPVSRFITEAREECQEVSQRIEETVWEPVESWISREEQRCREQDCNWWCLCCNKWFCWIVVVVVKVVEWVAKTIVRWVVELVCEIVTWVVGIIVELVLLVVTWLVTFVVCLFTNPGAAFASFRDLWTGILDILEDVVDFVGVLIDDVAAILTDVEDLLLRLADSFGPLGRLIFGWLAGAIHWLRDVVDLVGGLLEAVQDVLFGILRLDGCRIVSGLTNLAVGIGRIIGAVLRLPGGVLFGGPRHAFEADAVRRIVRERIEEAFAGDEERIERSISRTALWSQPFGVPVRLDVRRLCIRSNEFLRGLHAEGEINLYTLAGHVTDCDGRSPVGSERMFGEVVYDGSERTVTYADLEAFLEDGPEAAPPFTVYPMKRSAIRTYLEIARRKAVQIGVRLRWDGIADLPTTDPAFVPILQADDEAGGGAEQERLLGLLGRTGTDDDLSIVPSVAIFAYRKMSLNGLTTWFRPTGPDYSSRSGVTFRERFQHWVFRYVLVHELGHYFGLNHEGHPTLDFIMFSPQEGDFVSWAAAFEYLVVSGEPRFTTEDAQNAWNWITSTGADSLLP